jgi:CheY-like chemotaxis protein
MVISDVMLPGDVTGLQLARELRKRQPDLRILLTSGSVAPPAGMEEDEFPILLKPYSADSLARAIDLAFGTAPGAAAPIGC